jgi:hypothetical protein
MYCQPTNLPEEPDNMNAVFQVTGWIGAVLLLIAYMAISNNRLTSNSKVYHLLNLLGATLIVINTYHFNAHGPLALNIFWVSVAVFHLFRLAHR